MNEEDKREYQILHLAAGPLIPILELRQRRAKNQLLAAYNGGKDLLGPVARFVESHELLKEIQGKIDTFEALSSEEK